MDRISSDVLERDDDGVSSELVDLDHRSELVDDPAAVAHEQRIRAEQALHFKKLKGDAQALFGMVRGVPGVRTPQQWADMLEKAGDEIGNGKFILRWLGAERYLDPEIVAVMITLRQNLIADLHRATAAEIMNIDLAVLAYYNVLRVQGWIGNLSIVFERELFGEQPLSYHQGEEVGARLAEHIRRLADIILPLQDRTSRMMLRALGALPAGGTARSSRRGRPARSSPA